ncbi:ATP dependent DNA ligase domain-containing protein [Suillus paluster]|uniref:ATP dependent DNA ligase domain-containing protein n=1 Tax=Suillus paluster TaxID=48578 RepID=UPI001B879657|nr:ATP dependent DNA ligase domain-containing protein [Suillus paluster]KAG1728061.1 ATP dependent DNA ligase domain-containing protein [Suillus paluster]
MMQHTPAPTSPPGSPKPTHDEETTVYPPPPQNNGSAPFSVLVGLFEKLSTERKPERRRRLLDVWFNHWREDIGHDLYPVLRLILPQKDRERAVYGLKEKNLAKTYIKLIPLGIRDPDAIRLLNWKKPTEKDKSSGDFPTVLYEVVSKRSSVVEGSLSVHDLNEILDDLSKIMGKQDIQSRILQRIYNRATAEEQRWIVRIILKDMVISVKETTVFGVFHPDAQDLFNICSDLKKVAWELWDPSRRLNAEDKTIQLFRAFAPMLCKRPTHKIEDSVKEMQGCKFIIEEKLDGERMQLHKRGNEYFYCSRKGKDYTYLYGQHVGQGSLTPFIDSAFDERIDDIILDGEMLVWDPVSERNLPFGTLKTAALDKSKKEHNPRPCFKVFDLLYLNGMSLHQKSLKFRKRNLRACIQEIPGRIEFNVEFEGKTAKDVRQKMDEVMASRGEGLVIKHPDSEYMLNGRNKDWIKVKPEYMDNMGETVDVLVVAGNYGTGKRSGGVSTLICAVLDDRRPEGDEEPKYSTFVRVGTGLSFADYVWLRQKPWKVWDPKHPPEFLETAKRTYEDKGDLYLEPEDSFILKVKAAEITTSDQYHLGVTMRFPRALSIRDDLSIADCITASAILESMRSERKRKMESDAGSMSKKKRKTTAKKATVLPQYQGPNLRAVEIVSDLFEDMKFMVSSDPKSQTGNQDRQELMKSIRANGGTCVQVVTSQQPITVIYGGTTTPYDIKLLIDKGIVDIIRPQWITDCVLRRELVPLQKKYFFHATPERQESDDYHQMDVDEDQVMTDRTVEEDASLKVPTTPESIEPKIEDAEELADWFKIDTKPAVPEDSETEAESDADSNNEEEDADEEWFQVPEVLRSSTVEPLDDDSSTTLHSQSEDVTMGENDQAREYDTTAIFRHLWVSCLSGCLPALTIGGSCFYLDTPDNARKNGMSVKTKFEEEISTAFDQISRSIQENGGKIVALDDPKLTHVVLDKRDDSRRLTLIQRTSRPKRRRLVISDYVTACVEEESLLDEEDFAP